MGCQLLQPQALLYLIRLAPGSLTVFIDTSLANDIRDLFSVFDMVKGLFFAFLTLYCEVGWDFDGVAQRIFVGDSCFFLPSLLQKHQKA